MSANTNCILLVEDEKGIRNFILRSLESSGYQVVAAENGREAKEMFLAKCPDLVLLDLGLPDIDGVQLIPILRDWSNVPIIIVSARDQEAE